MPTLLFSLRGVPDDEAYEIRDLLEANNIDHYETSAGNWGISMPALWLNDNQDLVKAQKILNEYHNTRAIEQRMIYEQLKKDGGNKHILDVFKEKPLRFIIYIGAVAFVLYIYIKMLSEFGF
ncbi:MAG: DUF6164 family protein [Methylococcaceae bacterium]